MNARDELVEAVAAATYIARGGLTDQSERFVRWEDIRSSHRENLVFEFGAEDIADELIAAGYRKPRTITRPSQLEALPFGSAVQTSDESDTVVLRCEGRDFRNQSGAEVSVETLWRYGTHPFTVIYEPEAAK